MKLIGGEMPDWSDNRPSSDDLPSSEGRPGSGGAVLAHLLGRLGGLVPDGGRVLVAGPHQTTLLAALPDARITVLLRSLPDATQLADTGVDVLCGTLAKLTDTDRYDVVIALDGLDRLCSVEGPQLDWAESLRVLCRALKPGGSLLLSVENELGIHRLVDESSVTSAHTDGGWSPVGEFDPAKPGNPTRLAEHLAADGLTVSWLGAAWPLPEAPTMIATPAALNSSSAAFGPLGVAGGSLGALVAGVSGAVAAAYLGRPVLSDPRRLAAAAVRAGLGAELAASWLVVAHRAPGAPDTTDAPALPQVLLGDATPDPARNGVVGGSVGRLVQELSLGAEGRWVRRVVGRPGDVHGGGVVRDVGLLDGPVPAGRLAEELLLTACLRHDLPATRRLLTGWFGWLGGIGGGHAFATFDNVLLDGSAFALLDPSWDTTRPADPRVAAVRALRRFAVLLLCGGYAHPWPVAQDVDTLTTILAGAAGLELTAALLDDALALDAELAGSAETKTPTVAGVETGVLGWRERGELNRRLHEQLADATIRAEWYETELSRRDAELRKARIQIALFSGSSGFRLAKLGMSAARRAKGVARRIRAR